MVTYPSNITHNQTNMATSSQIKLQQLITSNLNGWVLWSMADTWKVSQLSCMLNLVRNSQRVELYSHKRPRILTLVTCLCVQWWMLLSLLFSSVQLSTVLQFLHILCFSSIFCTYEFFPAVTVWSLRMKAELKHNYYKAANIHWCSRRKHNALRAGGENFWTARDSCTTITEHEHSHWSSS